MILAALLFMVTSEVPAPVVTLAEFEQIRNDMTYEKVVEIAGAPGRIVYEAKYPGFHTVFYMWNSPWANSYVNCIFHNNELRAKAQFGLKRRM